MKNAKHKIRKNPVDETLIEGRGRSAIEYDYRLVGAETILSIHRTTAGNLNRVEAFECTYKEALNKGWLSTDNGTMEYHVRLADSEKSFPGQIQWVPKFKTYGALYPMF